MGVSIEVFSQDESLLDRRVSINIKNVSIYEALNRIGEISGCYFIYDSKDVRSDKKLTSVEASNETLVNLLRKTLVDPSLEFKVIEKHVLIFKRKIETIAINESSSDSLRYLLVGGKVFDKDTKNTIPFATVSIEKFFQACFFFIFLINNKIPVVLSKSDIQIFLQKCNSLKYKTIFSIIFSAGLRISEATNLKLSDLDFSRKTIYIRNSKNKKDRYTILADETIKLLKDYINIYRPIDFVFYSNDISKKISTDCIHKHFKAHIRYCEFDSTIHVHTLRHCFATHLLEEGTSIFYIMNLLGHSNIQTTMVYLHMQSLSSLNIKSPIDNMTINSTDKLACRNFELISA